MCSQKLSVAEIDVEGMATCCMTVSVVVVPQPFIQASNVPECGGSEAELLMICSGEWVEVSTQGEGLAAPASKPLFPSSSVPAGGGVGVGVGAGVGVGVGVGPPPESLLARNCARRTPARAICCRTTGVAF